MGLNATPSADRVHIGFFGRRNAGKSSVVNAVTGQELAVVSPVEGTTTDPVYKAMELLPLGPVMVIDTPGIDDEGDLGRMRVQKTKQVLHKTDVAVLVVDAAIGMTEPDHALLRLFEERKIPHIVAYNKCDLLAQAPPSDGDALYISATEKTHIEALKDKIAALTPAEGPKRRIVGDLLAPGDFVVLVTPIDEAAPKGRLILPQQQTIRDILESGAAAVAVQEAQLGEALSGLLKKPRLVITDSQVFAEVSAQTPPEIPLTSFSILFARYKGFLREAVRGAAALGRLRDGDTVLLSEGCTHHRQCGDIGRDKLPRWIKAHTGRALHFEFTSGTEFYDDLSKYALVVHCGGCMLNERAIAWRQETAAGQGVPITNYGIAIAHMQGILRRSIGLFPDALRELDG